MPGRQKNTYTNPDGSAEKTIIVKQVRSGIANKPKAGGTLRALGLGRIGKTAEHEDSPQLRGMLRQVDHLVRIDGKDV